MAAAQGAGVGEAVALVDEAATLTLARQLAGFVRPGDFIALSGDLGAGKTTLARGLLRALLADPELEAPSPTFTLMQVYDGPGYPVVHADFYRLSSPAEADEIGLDDYRQGAALLAEWPDRAGGFAHEPGCLTIRMETWENGRRAIVEPGRLWQERRLWT